MRTTEWAIYLPDVFDVLDTGSILPDFWASSRQVAGSNHEDVEHIDYVMGFISTSWSCNCCCQPQSISEPCGIILQDMQLDEDEDEEDDQEEDLISESEDGEAFDADGGADEDGNLGDDEDADGEVDDAYLKRLERESRRQKVRCMYLWSASLSLWNLRIIGI